MVSSYTANLAAFLVVENKSSKINGVESFKECVTTGTECPADVSIYTSIANNLFQNTFHIQVYNDCRSFFFFFPIHNNYHSQDDNALQKQILN